MDTGQWFVSRRGTPSYVYFDQGSQLVKAAKTITNSDESNTGVICGVGRKLRH